MSKREVTVCDGCQRIIESKTDTYHLVLKSDRFWDGVEMTENIQRLDFCERCARNIKDSLVKIAAR